jgi:hypothetical protein
LVNDSWYLSLFPQGRVAGEVAESYCSLERDRVRHIHDVTPNVKMIFALRNPIERALSQAKNGLVVRKNRRIEDVSEDEFIMHLNRPESQARSRYSDTLDIWYSFFSREQLLILFYEDLIRSPEDYLSNICHFLGVRFKRGYFNETIRTTVLNKSPDGSLPSAVVKHAARTYREEVETLANRFGGPALRWQHEAECILDSASPTIDTSQQPY